MLEVRPVKVFVKVPVILPSIVWLLLIVGEGEVLQHKPHAVKGEPPSDDMLTTPSAVVEVELENAVIVTVGAAAPWMQRTDFPYAPEFWELPLPLPRYVELQVKRLSKQFR